MSPTSTCAHLARALGKLSPVSDAAAEALAACAARRTFARGAWLLRGGDRAESCFLVIRGLVRELYIDDDGSEHTRAFVAEGGVTGSLLDLLSHEPSVTWIQAVEATDTIAWSYAAFDVLTRRYADLNEVARRHAELLYVRKTLREHEMLALAAPERYRRWREQQPDLDARISRRDLASYLGITPEHLSRLRRQVPRSASRR